MVTVPADILRSIKQITIPTPMILAKAQTKTAVDHATTCSGIAALLILVYSGLAALSGLPGLPTAATLSLSVGLSSVIVRLLQQRPALGVVWAEFTAWIGLVFLLGSMWNALFLPLGPALAVDLALSLLVLLLGFGVARAARRPADPKATSPQGEAVDQR